MEMNFKLLSFPQFLIGQKINHLLFHYRGVIVSRDLSFKGSENWYLQMSVGKEYKDRPWYHVLVHNSKSMTYIAEKNLEIDSTEESIHHPLLQQYFNTYESGRYFRS